MTKAERKKLKARLRFGDLKKIAKAAEVTYVTVNEWFNDRTDNRFIEEAAKALADKRDEQVKKKVAEIKES